MAPPSDKRVDEAVRLLVTGRASSAPEAMKFTNGFSPEEIQIKARTATSISALKGNSTINMAKALGRTVPPHCQSSQVAPAPARKVSRSASLKISIEIHRKREFSTTKTECVTDTHL